MQAAHYDSDFFSDAFIRDPIPRYAEMRALSPVLWLPRNNVYAVARDREVRDVLRRADTFISGRGLSLNEDVNTLLIGNSLNSDGAEHMRKRSVTARPIMPKNLEPLREFIEERASELADTLARQGSFDAVMEFAQVLPLTVVVDLVGLNDSGRDRMLDWAAAAFNLFEGFNARSTAAFDTLVGLQDYLKVHGTRDALKPGGLARRIFDVAPEKGFSEPEAAQLMRDYINPSLDTTVSALGFAAYFFARNPDQWERMRAEPDFVPNAVEEIVRLATPIRAFSRYAAEDTEVSGVAIPEGSRILAIYASANRDDRVWQSPDRFDITREVRKHMGFGHGVHTCMGMHLARLEMVSLLRAMAARVARWEIVGTPRIAMNNTIRAFSHLPVKVVAA